MLGADIADTAGKHDRFMVPADFTGHRLFKRTKIAADIRPTEFIVERRPSNRAFEHNPEGAGNPLGLAVIDLPSLQCVG